MLKGNMESHEYNPKDVLDCFYQRSITILDSYLSWPFHKVELRVLNFRWQLNSG